MYKRAGGGGGEGEVADGLCVGWGMWGVRGGYVNDVVRVVGVVPVVRGDKKIETITYILQQKRGDLEHYFSQRPTGLSDRQIRFFARFTYDAFHSLGVRVRVREGWGVGVRGGGGGTRGGG